MKKVASVIQRRGSLSDDVLIQLKSLIEKVVLCETMNIRNVSCLD